MHILNLPIREILHRWKSSLVVVFVIASITGVLAFFAVNDPGYQKEVGRNVRDIGSNIVILPIDVDQFDYHANGGYSEVIMDDKVVDQLIEYRASLNHLIPMLERKTSVAFGERKVVARVIGLSGSIAMPGRPKAPMQRAVKKETVQLGSKLAESLGIDRDAQATVTINDKQFVVERVNKSTGSWQDSVVLMDLDKSQQLFAMPGKISRIEAIECTQEQCEATGFTSEKVLVNELAKITDKATLLRREQMATARAEVRLVTSQNQALIQNALWVFMVFAVVGLTTMNVMQRKSEIGVLHSVGISGFKISSIFVMRAVLLTATGALVGICCGALICFWQSSGNFLATGKKFSIDWTSVATVGVVSIVLAMIASLIPSTLAAMRNPAELIGRES